MHIVRRGRATARIDRRRFLTGAGTLAGLLMLGRLAGGRPLARPSFGGYPFSLGVASGDPLPDGVVLWTRLAPDPLNGGGMPPEPITVHWQVAADEAMRTVVQSGTATASPLLGHAVHVDVRGLDPGRPYWYRFKAGSELSPIGRTRTAPAAGASPERLRFAFASCQHYEQGYYPAYRHMAEEDLDLVVHLGDYIYEAAPAANRPRRHTGDELVTLDDYRNRYALYKLDADLQAAHHAFPWVVTWDDHEVVNNYAGALDPRGSPPEDFLVRRANAYQAYYEHMPLRPSSLPAGPDLLLYRRLSFGDLVTFSVLDTRQYRTDQPCGDGFKARCPAALDEAATLTGPEQERWLLDGLGASTARWNVIAQQVVMAQLLRIGSGGQAQFNMDAWDGYVAARNRILGFLNHRRPSNPVVITGDVHSSWVADLKADFDEPRSATVGVEFVGTSISSAGDGADTTPMTEAILRANPHVHFTNSLRGYVRCAVTPTVWQADYRVVDRVSTPDAEVRTRASFVVEAGRPGVVRL